MRNVLLNLMVVLSVFSVQGCWADDRDDPKNAIYATEENADISSDNVSTESRSNHGWNLYGSYNIPFQADCRNVDNQIEECKVNNTLKIKELSDDLVKISIGIIGGNLHQCQLEGVAHKKGEYLEYQEKYTDSLGKERECILDIKIEGENIVLYDNDRNCKRRYCGQRAGFSGKKFPVSK